ncbi:MAG: hypothetical protein K2X87_10525, partial [Gemmataceae bacterium]|nr:hypothetical protein [Gemmataceae bacterium]
RDIALDGRLPVVFFDEFDSTLPGPGGELGWLKRFLPVMQDGEFKHGERAMKVGGPVFVFAGGTCKNYQEFCRVGADDDRRKAFVAVKGPDFVSRLRGHVDIRGADRAAGENQEFMIRRAVFIRSNMWKEHRPCFSSPDDERGADLRIDDAVLDALLRVGTYKHGARSLEAVIAMSRLAEAGQFDAAMLPSADQLNMHVDGVEFLDLVKDYPGRPPTRGRR